MSPKTQNWTTRSITGLFYVAIMVVGFMRPIAMAFVFVVITGMSVWEFCTLVNERENITINRFICSTAGVFLSLAMFGYCSGLTPPIVFVPYLLTIIYLFVSELYLCQEDPIHDWAYAMMSQLFIALPLATVNILAYYSGEFYYLVPLAVFIFLWCSDTGAFIAGSLFGRHKLFERISPGKTWEGSVGGAILVLAAATLIWRLERDHLSGFTLVEWMGLGLVVVVFGTWGDLIESLLKRTLGIKDSGSILPGHGGMLDRFDSALMAIPASVVYIYTLFMII